MYGSLGEAIVRATLEEYFPGLPFIKTRSLPWLRRPGGYPLEIDCYNDSLRLAVEYQGAQHYEFIPYFHVTEDRFADQQERDQFKREASIDATVALLEVSCEVPFAQIRAHLHRELYFLGYDPPSAPLLSDHDLLTKAAAEGPLAVVMLDRARKVAESHGGRCLSEAYVSCHEPLRFVCRGNHQFAAPLASVNEADHVRPRFCPDCGGTRKRTFDENKQLVESCGYVLLGVDSTRIGVDLDKTTRLQVRCPGGHEYPVLRTNFLPVINGKPKRGCIRCARERTNRTRAVAEREATAAAFGLQILSAFVPRHEPMSWRCLAKGHEFVASWHTVRIRKNGKCLECVGLARSKA